MHSSGKFNELPKGNELVEKHLRRPAVEEITGLSRSTIYEKMDRGEFPRPIRVGRRAVAWPESAVLAWLAKRPTAQRSVG